MALIRPLSVPVSRRVRLVAFATAALLLALATILAAIAVVRLPEHPCSTPPALAGRVPELVEVGACLAAIGIGRLLGGVRLLPRERAAAAGPASHRVRTAVVLQAGLVAFLLLVGALLWYETFALNNLDRFWPITYYVRCANDVAGLPTLSAAVAVSFLFGHWFWPPPSARRRSAG